MRGRPTTYIDRVVTSVSIERRLRNVAHALDINFSNSLAYGLQILIDYRIKSGEKIDSKTLNEWKQVREKQLGELTEFIKIEQDKQTLLSDIIKEKTEADTALNEMIDVWDDNEEKYRTIKRKDFRPAWMTIRGRSDENR